MNYYSQLNQRALFQCEYILSGGDESILEKVKSIDDWIIEQAEPKSFDPDDSKNVVSQLIESYEDLSANLEELGVKKPFELSVYKFYSRVRYYKKKHSKSKSS